MGHVGQEVRRLRIERNMNQAQLAVAIGTGPSAISEIENGRRDPGAGTLRKLAGALGVEVGDLFPKAQAPLLLEEASAAPFRADELPGLQPTRERQGMSRDELAFRTGIPAPEIEALEDGRRPPEPGTVELLADALSCFKGDLVLPAAVMEAVRAREAEENERIARELEKLTTNDIRALKLASPAFRKLSEAYRKGAGRPNGEQQVSG